MGANCCVAMRDKPLPGDPRFESLAYRNARYSPSWSFRWDNRTHIEDIVDNPARFSRHGGGDVSFEIKSETETETEGFSNEGSPSAAFEKFSVKRGIAQKPKDGDADPSIGSNSSAEQEKGTTKGTGSASTSFSVLSTPSSSTFNLDPSSSRTRSLPPDPTSSRKARRSPGYQLSRQVSDSRIPSLKSLNENSSPEGGRQSFVLSGESRGGSSDGWSMRMFSDLVASSQRDRWSFDSSRSNTQPLPSLSADPRSCGVCSKLLKERVSLNDLSVVAVLFCGHAYHAECLESVTLETDRFEPPCPACANGDKPALKLKARSKISRIAVADVDGVFDPGSMCQKEGGKGPRMSASSSMKSSFVRPFLRRHFSLGSRPPRPVSENETTRKKGFWGRYHRD